MRLFFINKRLDLIEFVFLYSIFEQIQLEKTQHKKKAEMPQINLLSNVSNKFAKRTRLNRFFSTLVQKELKQADRNSKSKTLFAQTPKENFTNKVNLSKK